MSAAPQTGCDRKTAVDDGQSAPTRDRTRLISMGAALLSAVVVTNIVALLLGPERRVDSGDVVFLSGVVGIAVLIWASVLWAARTCDHANRAAVFGVVTGVVGVLGRNTTRASGRVRTFPDGEPCQRR